MLKIDTINTTNIPICANKYLTLLGTLFTIAESFHGMHAKTDITNKPPTPLSVNSDVSSTNGTPIPNIFTI